MLRAAAAALSAGAALARAAAADDAAAGVAAVWTADTLIPYGRAAAARSDEPRRCGLPPGGADGRAGDPCQPQVHRLEEEASSVCEH